MTRIDHNCKYDVYTVDGKLLGTITGTLVVDKEGLPRLNTREIQSWLNGRHLTSGVYLVSTRNNAGSQVISTQKVVITK